MPRLARRIAWIAWTLLAGAAATFAWGMFFTRGVGPLIDALLISVLGFLFPSIFVFWVCWVVDRGEPGDEERRTGARLGSATEARTRQRPRVIRYGFAAVATAMALAVRWLLLPWLSVSVPYATFYLAVAGSAWFGGIGPAILSAALSLIAVWFWYVGPVWALGVDRVGDVATMGLFFAVATTIGGITAALRAAQMRARSLIVTLQERQRALEDSERRFRDVANDLPALLWMFDEAGACTFVNRAVVEFTGSPTRGHAGSGWLSCLHPDDAAEQLPAVRKLLEARKPVTWRYRLRHQDGGYRWMHDEARPRFDDAGNFTGYIRMATELPVQGASRRADQATAPG